MAETPNATPHSRVRKARRSSGATATAAGEPLETRETTAAALNEGGAPEADPLAEATRDSARFRLVHATASPDGGYALAIGFEQPPEWTRAQEADVDGEEVFTVEVHKETRPKNYVVGLATKRILAQTGDAPALQPSGNRGDVVAPFCRE